MTLQFESTSSARSVSAELTVGTGETLAILGPNGAGKSTLLGVLAGLIRPDSGRADLDGRVLFDLPLGARGSWLPPHEREVSLLAQDALLFPHLSALENVAFGPRSRGASRRDAEKGARDWLHRVDASDLSDRRPGALSGGQAQRIAVARALASDPSLLLLDEPLAALDVTVAPALRGLLRTVLAERTAIIVTHDVLDAYTLADRVVILEEGRIVDSGSPREVLERPLTPFAARLAGLNLLVGTLGREGVSLANGSTVRVGSIDGAVQGQRTAVTIRPADVRVERTAPIRGEFDSMPGVVLDLEPRGDLVRVRSTLVTADVAPRRVAELDLVPGATVHFVFRSADAVTYPIG